MKKLLIIVYKLNVSGFSRQQAEEGMCHLIESYNLREDEELKNYYMIREIYLPVTTEESDVKIIYPIPKYTTSPELNDLVQEITDRIKEDPTNVLNHHWEKLVRELKLRKLEIC